MNVVGTRTLGTALADKAMRFPERLFVIAEDAGGIARPWTWRQFDVTVNRAAHLLLARGLKPGAKFNLHLGNGPAFLVFWLAAARTGTVMVPTNPASTADEMAYILAHSEARLAVTERRYREVVLAARDRGSDLGDVIDATPLDPRVPADAACGRQPRHRGALPRVAVRAAGHPVRRDARRAVRRTDPDVIGAAAVVGRSPHAPAGGVVCAEHHAAAVGRLARALRHAAHADLGHDRDDVVAADASARPATETAGDGHAGRGLRRESRRRAGRGRGARRRRRAARPRRARRVADEGLLQESGGDDPGAASGLVAHQRPRVRRRRGLVLLRRPQEGHDQACRRERVGIGDRGDAEAASGRGRRRGGRGFPIPCATGPSRHT